MLIPERLIQLCEIQTDFHATVSDEMRQLADATFVKKKMYTTTTRHYVSRTHQVAEVVFACFIKGLFYIGRVEDCFLAQPWILLCRRTSEVSLALEDVTRQCRW